MLAILTTHPIQYQVPLWQALANDGRVPFEVWYLTSHGVKASHDSGFGKTFAWDIDTLSGYPHRFLNVAPGAAPDQFWKCRLVEPLRKRLRESGATALWIQGWQVAAYWQAVREARAAGVKVWLRGESNDLAPTAAWKRPIKRTLLRWFFSHVDEFLYIGTANKRLYQSYGVPEQQLYPAPYAVDNDRFANEAAALRPERDAIRRAWNIPQDAFCVLFCGKFIPKKRPVDLVAAVQLAAPKLSGRPIHLLFVGSGELGYELRKRCRVVYDAEFAANLPAVSAAASIANDNRPQASFSGFLNQHEIARAYVAADCLVLPSNHQETWGLVVNEALACGCPCITSDACGCNEDLVVPVDKSSSFSCGNITSLADALTSVAIHSPLSSQTGVVLARHSFDTTVRRVVSLSLGRREYLHALQTA